MKKNKKKHTSKVITMSCICLATVGVASGIIYYNNSQHAPAQTQSGQNSDVLNDNHPSTMSGINESTTAQPTTAAPVTLTQVPLADGSYDYKFNTDSIDINYVSLDKSTTKSWHASMPDSIEINQYTTAIVDFYDDNNGLLLIESGAGAGNVYYNVYFTANAGKTWAHQESIYKKTSSDTQIEFLNSSTAILLDTGIGISVPSISIFTYKDNILSTSVEYSHIPEINVIPASITMELPEGLDSTTLSLTYTTYESDKPVTVTSNLAQYTK